MAYNIHVVILYARGLQDLASNSFYNFRMLHDILHLLFEPVHKEWKLQHEIDLLCHSVFPTRHTLSRHHDMI